MCLRKCIWFWDMNQYFCACDSSLQFTSFGRRLNVRSREKRRCAHAARAGRTWLAVGREERCTTQRRGEVAMGFFFCLRQPHKSTQYSTPPKNKRVSDILRHHFYPKSFEVCRFSVKLRLASIVRRKKCSDIGIRIQGTICSYICKCSKSLNYWMRKYDNNNFGIWRVVLGCIEADVLQVKAHVAACF